MASAYISTNAAPLSMPASTSVMWNSGPIFGSKIAGMFRSVVCRVAMRNNSRSTHRRYRLFG